jgi:hypothetical protein
VHQRRAHAIGLSLETLFEVSQKQNPNKSSTVRKLFHRRIKRAVGGFLGRVAAAAGQERAELLEWKKGAHRAVSLLKIATETP